LEQFLRLLQSSGAIINFGFGRHHKTHCPKQERRARFPSPAARVCIGQTQ
jgi:hypothetical protein